MAFSARSTVIPPFDIQHLTAIAKVLGETERGLTNPEIWQGLAVCNVPDTVPGGTKWKHLFYALANFQNKHQAGNHVVKFIMHAMNPAAYTDRRDLFEHRRRELNAVLCFCGMAVGDDGKVRNVERANTLNEAMQRASRLQFHLQQRNVHTDVLRFCSAEILAENYFHAVFEAMKSVTAKIRGMSGLTGDGSELVDQVFSLGQACSPMFAINKLDSDSLKGEQRGFVSLLKGLYGTIRNPLAHNAKIEWEMDEQDALDTLTTISLVHRKLDKAYRVR